MTMTAMITHFHWVLSLQRLIDTTLVITQVRNFMPVKFPRINNNLAVIKEVNILVISNKKVIPCTHRQVHMIMHKTTTRICGSSRP